ncbi:adenylate/guanylate cyclase domain-containing protein [Paracoccus aestuariivivens]|uniref:adenylate/guanylate cyclase domain-containing protein n=1 Tax=Paracoccus aestuariivivens TaxID=1820333 RepID=UPI0012BAD136|nr:adenylate/guanylate cyclase domain-containing protein [Paracoccus aestuariivivens]
MSLSNPRLLTVLFADIHEYTRLVERDEQNTIIRVTDYLALIRDLIADYGGAVVNTAGDGFVATFENPSQAVSFALEMQRALARETGAVDGNDQIRYRVGISIGDTFEGQDGVYGHSVNLAARVQSFAEPGGICITGAIYRLVRHISDLRPRSIGTKRLKNITTPLEIFALDLNFVPRRNDAVVAQWKSATLADSIPDASLAVLPMENLSGGKDDEFLCQGIVSDLITSLSRFRSLMVIARRSSALAASQAASLRSIGQNLGVRYLLTGSLRRSGNRVRMTFDLIEAARENTLWSERYDGILTDIFDFQDDIASTTASRVAIQMDMVERRRLAEQSHPALYAYGLVQRGQFLGSQFSPSANLGARQLFEQASLLDPSYSGSYAAKSRTFNVEWRYNWSRNPEAAVNEALNLAERAVQCDALDTRGLSEMGLAHLYKRQYSEAVAAYERALALNPNDADLLANMGDCLANVGQSERAVQLLERAIKLNPFHPDEYLWFLGDAYFHKGDYRKTIETLGRLRDQSEAYRLLTASYALLGLVNDARHYAGELMRIQPDFSIGRLRTLSALKRPEDREIYVDGLRRAGLH